MTRRGILARCVGSLVALAAVPVLARTSVPDDKKQTGQDRPVELPKASGSDIVFSGDKGKIVYSGKTPEVIVHLPRYEHDCEDDACMFLGHHGVYDLYFCIASRYVIARHEIADLSLSRHISQVDTADPLSILSEAARRAEHFKCITQERLVQRCADRLIAKAEYVGGVAIPMTPSPRDKESYEAAVKLMSGRDWR